LNFYFESKCACLAAMLDSISGHGGFLRKFQGCVSLSSIGRRYTVSECMPSSYPCIHFNPCKHSDLFLYIQFQIVVAIYRYLILILKSQACFVVICWFHAIVGPMLLFYRGATRLSLATCHKLLNCRTITSCWNNL
jgi:hypothetical protein